MLGMASAGGEDVAPAGDTHATHYAATLQLRLEKWWYWMRYELECMCSNVGARQIQ